MNISAIKSMKSYADRKRTRRKKNSTAIKDNQYYIRLSKFMAFFVKQFFDLLLEKYLKLLFYKQMEITMTLLF